MTTKRKCECQRAAVLRPGMESLYDSEKELPYVNHEPGKCLCTNELCEYQRGGKTVLLCSCCC